METTHKVIWSEGMFLQPQHFQQYDRYIQHLCLHRPGLVQPHNWGIQELKIDTYFLALGKFSPKSCAAIFPDGMFICTPYHDNLPLPLDLKEGLVNTIIYLALPLQRSGHPVAAYDQDNYRYRIETVEISDDNFGTKNHASIQIGTLCLKLMLEGDNREGYSCIPIARIQEVNSSKQILLDEAFIPPCLVIQAYSGLIDVLLKLQGLLHYRGARLIERLSGATAGVADVSDFLFLQIINRYEPLLHYFLEQKAAIHPQQLYQLLIQLTGELATFTSAQRRCTKFKSYEHLQLQSVFGELIRELRGALNTLLEETTVLLRLEEKQPNLLISTLNDRNLLNKAVFILAVYADMPLDRLRTQFPAQVKIAPIEELRNLVNRALPGIDLQPLQIVPRQIPFHADYAYFVLNKDHLLWKNISQSAEISFHIGGVFPGLKLELWAVKG